MASPHIFSVMLAVSNRSAWQFGLVVSTQPRRLCYGGKRGKKRRVMTAGFLADVERTLAPGGKLHFWTDVEEYFQSTLDLIGEVTCFQGPYEVPERSPEHDLDYRTHFERRTRLSGEPVYRAEFLRPIGS